MEIVVRVLCLVEFDGKLVVLGETGLAQIVLNSLVIIVHVKNKLNFPFKKR